MTIDIEPTRLARRWILEDDTRPWTVNAERSWHFHKRAAHVRECRERFGWLALGQQVPRLTAVKIAAVPLAKDRRGIQDVAACLPAVKAAIDGIVDAGVIDDDDPRFVHSLTFLPTQVVGRDGLRVVVTEVLSDGHES